MDYSHNSANFYNALWRNVNFDLFKFDQINIIKKLIPSNLNSFLDVGCGNGFITNQLLEMGRFQTIGVDISLEGVKQLHCPGAVSDICNLPFKNNYFDCVSAIEVLEHLPNSIYKESICEIKRISRRYILVSVPLKESLFKRYAKCSNCGGVFNSFLHCNVYNEADLERLFDDEFCMAEKDVCGPMEYNYSEKAYLFLQNYFKAFWPYDGVCPYCQKHFCSKGKWIVSFLDKVGRLILKARPYWIVCLYTRKHF